MSKQETVIDIAVWNDQTGEWFDLTEARSPDEARRKVERYRIDDEAEGRTSRYQIRTTTTEEV